MADSLRAFIGHNQNTDRGFGARAEIAGIEQQSRVPQSSAKKMDIASFLKKRQELATNPEASGNTSVSAEPLSPKASAALPLEIAERSAPDEPQATGPVDNAQDTDEVHAAGTAIALALDDGDGGDDAAKPTEPPTEPPLPSAPVVSLADLLSKMDDDSSDADEHAPTAASLLQPLQSLPLSLLSSSALPPPPPAAPAAPAPAPSLPSSPSSAPSVLSAPSSSSSSSSPPPSSLSSLPHCKVASLQGTTDADISAVMDIPVVVDTQSSAVAECTDVQNQSQPAEDSPVMVEKFWAAVAAAAADTTADAADVNSALSSQGNKKTSPKRAARAITSEIQPDQGASDENPADHETHVAAQAATTTADGEYHQSAESESVDLTEEWGHRDESVRVEEWSWSDESAKSDDSRNDNDNGNGNGKDDLAASLDDSTRTTEPATTTLPKEGRRVTFAQTLPPVESYTDQDGWIETKKTAAPLTEETTAVPLAGLPGANDCPDADTLAEDNGDNDNNNNNNNNNDDDDQSEGSVTDEPEVDGIVLDTVAAPEPPLEPVHLLDMTCAAAVFFDHDPEAGALTRTLVETSLAILETAADEYLTRLARVRNGVRLTMATDLDALGDVPDVITAGVEQGLRSHEAAVEAAHIILSMPWVQETKGDCVALRTRMNYLHGISEYELGGATRVYVPIDAFKAWFLRSFINASDGGAMYLAWRVGEGEALQQVSREMASIFAAAAKVDAIHRANVRVLIDRFANTAAYFLLQRVVRCGIVKHFAYAGQANDQAGSKRCVSDFTMYKVPLRECEVLVIGNADTADDPVTGDDRTAVFIERQYVPLVLAVAAYAGLLRRMADESLSALWKLDHVNEAACQHILSDAAGPVYARAMCDETVWDYYKHANAMYFYYTAKLDLCCGE